MSSNQFSRPYIDKITTKSISNGTHVLISIFLPTISTYYLYIISNDNSSKYETICGSLKELNISMDSKHVYIFNLTNMTIDVFNLMLQFQSHKSIKINLDLSRLFVPSALLKVSDTMLYVFNCENDSVDIFQLPDMKLKKSITINAKSSPISRHFINDSFVLRYKDCLKFFNFKSERSFIKAISDTKFSDPDLTLKAADENNFLLLNLDESEYYVLNKRFEKQNQC